MSLNWIPLMVSVATMVSSWQSKTLFEFKMPAEEETWYIVNDGVMGGLSRSDMIFKQGKAIFQGNVSLENYGGFASVRAEIPEIDLNGFQRFRLRVKGDGKTYKFRVRTNRRFDGVAYSVDFSTRAGEWQTHSFSADQFVPVFRGRVVRGAPPLRLASVKQLGFLISDKQEGPFRLNIDVIEITADPEP